MISSLGWVLIISRSVSQSKLKIFIFYIRVLVDLKIKIIKMYSENILSTLFEEYSEYVFKISILPKFTKVSY